MFANSSTSPSGRRGSVREIRPRQHKKWIASLLVAAAMITTESALATNSIQKDQGHLLNGKALIETFQTTPFPYSGMLPDRHVPFLDVQQASRTGHTSPRGGIYWSDKTYSSKNVLIYLPKNFTDEKPVVIVVFLHGNNVLLGRDVWHRQQVVSQLEKSRLNAVLVAPQFAVDALDSSAGAFWNPGIFARFIAEAKTKINLSLNDAALARLVNVAPIILVAYSGGYNAAAYILSNEEIRDNLCGVILLDALFGERQRFASWMEKRHSAFFISAFSASSQSENQALELYLKNKGMHLGSPLDLRTKIPPGDIIFIPALQARHNDFVTSAWVKMPLQFLLSKVGDCRKDD